MKNNKLKMVLKIVCAVLCATIIITGSVCIAAYVMQDDIDALSARLDGASSEIADLQDKYESALQELDALKVEQAQTKGELEELRGELGNAKQDLSMLMTDIDALRNELQVSKDDIEILRGENQILKQEIEKLKTPKIKIYIDQGHNPTGYYNSGATGNGYFEQDLTFVIGVLLADMLEADGRFEVCLSRPTANAVLGTDNDSSLDARVEGAKDFEADYFISLHTNSFDDPELADKVSGFEIYAAEAGSASYEFGNSLLPFLTESTNLRNRGMKISNDLRILKNATMPAILIEMGFISHPSDATLMAESPELFASGIYNGILSYFKLSAPIV